MSIRVDDAVPGRLYNTVELSIYRGDRLVGYEKVTNSRVDAGAIAMCAQSFSTAAQPAAFNYVALAGSTLTPAHGDTTLAGEITTGGLARKQASYTAPSAPGTLNATAAATLSATWTSGATGTIYGVGALNASSGGTLGLETALGTSLNYNNGDVVVLTWTLNY